MSIDYSSAQTVSGEPLEVSIFCAGSAKRDLLNFSEQVKHEIGVALNVAQFGGKHPIAVAINQMLETLDLSQTAAAQRLNINQLKISTLPNY